MQRGFSFEVLMFKINAKTGVIVIALIILTAIFVPNSAGDSLTDEQKLAIISDCHENPDSIRCR